MVDVDHARRRQRPDLRAQRVVALQQVLVFAPRWRRPPAAPARRPNRRDRRCCKPHSCNCGARPCLRLSGWSSTGMSGSSSAKPSSAPTLKLSATMRVSGRHRRAQFAHRVGQCVPAGEVARIPLRRRRLRAQRRRRHRGVVAQHRDQAQRRGERHVATRSQRGQRAQQRRQQRQQREVAGQRPVEAHALGVGEEAEHEEAQHHQRAEPARNSARPGCRRGGARQAASASATNSSGVTSRAWISTNHDAVGMERPGMAVDQLEAQAGVGVAQVPRQQRRPCRGAERDRHPAPADRAARGGLRASAAGRRSRRRSRR